MQSGLLPDLANSFQIGLFVFRHKSEPFFKSGVDVDQHIDIARNCFDMPERIELVRIVDHFLGHHPLNVPVVLQIPVLFFEVGGIWTFAECLQLKLLIGNYNFFVDNKLLVVAFANHLFVVLVLVLDY